MDLIIADIITKDVVDQLKWDDRVDDSHIRVKVTENHVFLEGYVDSYASKIAASHDAYLVPGVKHVVNNLEVRLTEPSNAPTDEEVSRKIQELLKWNVKIDASGIEVTTHSGVVTLRGNVSSFWEKFEAEDIASHTLGVTGVTNQLGVKVSKTVVDEEIERDIRNAYERSILIDESKIIIDCSRGEVRISGSVANYAIKREALDIANYTRGVANVIDEITIE